MKLQDVEALAELAKLELSQDEKEGLLRDMEGILKYVEQIEEVKVGDIEAKDMLYNVWREDELSPRAFSKELILEQFPDSQDSFLKVKKIL